MQESIVVSHFDAELQQRCVAIAMADSRSTAQPRNLPE
jgi:hypothetical protein